MEITDGVLDEGSEITEARAISDELELTEARATSDEHELTEARAKNDVLELTESRATSDVFEHTDGFLDEGLKFAKAGPNCPTTPLTAGDPNTLPFSLDIGKEPIIGMDPEPVPSSTSAHAFRLGIANALPPIGFICSMKFNLIQLNKNYM